MLRGTSGYLIKASAKLFIRPFQGALRSSQGLQLIGLHIWIRWGGASEGCLAQVSMRSRGSGSRSYARSMDHLQSRGAERPLLRVGKDQRMRPGARRDEISRPPKLGQGAGIGRSRVNVTEREVGQGPSVFLRRGSGHGGRARMSERDAPEAWGELMGEGRGDEGRKDQRGGEVDWAVGRAAGVSVASKLIARSGLCSRRKAAKLAKDGHVSLNGQVLIDLSTRIDPRRDTVMVDGVKLKAIEPSRVWKVYKPKEVLTQMHADPKKRKTLLDVLKKYGQDLGELHCIGRLDYWTEGLLLLTNDGELKRAMELPSSGLKRVYRVRVRGRMGEQQVKALTAGVTVEGVKYKGMEVEIDDPRLGTHQEQRREDPVRWGEAEGQDDKVGGEEEGRDSFANHWVSVALREGKNREVRNAMVHVGLTVMRLLRVSYGPIGLQDMQKGSLSTLSAREASQLGRQLRELKLSGVAKNAQQKAGENDTE